MAVKNNDGRLAMERDAMGVYVFCSKVGLVLAFLLCLSGIVVGGAAVIYGYSLAGFGLFFSSLAALVVASVYRDKNRGGQ